MRSRGGQWAAQLLCPAPQRLQDFHVHPLGGLVGAHVLASELLTDTDHMPGKALIAVRIRSNISALAHRQLANVSLVHVHAHAQRALVADSEDGVRGTSRVRHTLAFAVMLAQHSRVEWR